MGSNFKIDQRAPKLSDKEMADEMDPEPTTYDEWKLADGFFPGKAENKKITFKSSSEDSKSNREDSVGFVRIDGGEEGYTIKDKERTFSIPPGASFEVLGGCWIKFTRA